jgi:hypothetical protein
MADIPEEVRKRMVRLAAATRYVRRYASEDRQWPRNMPHPSGRRPIVADLILQEQWVDGGASMQSLADGTALIEWRDVQVVPEVEGLPEDHEFTREDRQGHLRASSLSTDFKGR